MKRDKCNSGEEIVHMSEDDSLQFVTSLETGIKSKQSILPKDKTNTSK